MALTKAGIEIENSRILIIGAGGVVRPTLIRLIDNKPKSITVVNRTKSKAKTLAEDILKSTGFEVNTEIDKLEFDIVINTTSAGMEPQENVMPIENIEEINEFIVYKRKYGGGRYDIQSRQNIVFARGGKTRCKNSKRTWYANISRNYCI